MEESSRSDAELIRSVLNSNEKDFAVLMERYQQKIFAYLYRFLFQNKEAAMDLTQDVFLKVYQNLDSVDTKRPFQPWVYRIAHNEAANYLRSKSRKKESQLSDEYWENLPNQDNTDGLESEEIKRAILRAMDKIDRKYKEVLILFYFEELSYQEIAVILKSTTNTVGTFIRRGKQQLQKQLEGIIDRTDMLVQMVFFTTIILIVGRNFGFQ